MLTLQGRCISDATKPMSSPPSSVKFAPAQSYFKRIPENELQRNARKRAEFKEMNKKRIAEDMKWMDNRMEGARTAQCLATIKSQAEIAEGQPDRSQIVNERANKEALMAKEIKAIEEEKACELLRRHHLREKEPTLRELISKIQAGYVCRDVKQQIQNNEYRRAQDRLEELKKDQFLNSIVYNEKKQAAQEEKQEFDRMMCYKNEITKQKLDIMERRQRERDEERLWDKKMLEDIKKKLAEDEFRELQRKNEKKEKLRREMLDFQEKRRILKEQEMVQAKIEEQRLKEQARETPGKEAVIAAKREEKFRKLEKVNERIMNQVRQNEAEMRKRAELINLLQEQEYLEKNVQDEIAEKEKEHFIKRETKDVLTWQMKSRIEAAAQERAREVEFRKFAEKKAYEELEKERVKEQKLKESRKRYAEELKQQLLDNEMRRKRAREEEQLRVQNVLEHNQAWLVQVEEERKKIVQEHVPQVLGCLQKGVIQPEDLPAVEEGVQQKREQLTSLDIDSMKDGRKQKYPKCNFQCAKIRNF